MSTATCPHCDHEFSYNVISARFSPIGLLCPNCGGDFTKAAKATKRGRSDNQIRSRDQEKKAAARYGGKRQPGSGSSRRAKGDFIDAGKLRGECKFTRAASFSLKLAELLKLESEATALETPLFEVQFQGVHPAKTYVVVPADTYQVLMDELVELRRLSEDNR